MFGWFFDFGEMLRADDNSGLQFFKSLSLRLKAWSNIGVVKTAETSYLHPDEQYLPSSFERYLQRVQYHGHGRTIDPMSVQRKRIAQLGRWVARCHLPALNCDRCRLRQRGPMYDVRAAG